MIIRCERCSTLYELDEGLLAPEGSQVQCAKCQAIFVALPPRAAATPVPAAPAAPPAPSPSGAPHAPEPPPQATTNLSPAASAPEAPARAAGSPPEAPPPGPRDPEPSGRAAEPAPRAAEASASPATASAPSIDLPPKGGPQRPARTGPAVYRAQPTAPRPTGGKPNARTGRRSALRPGPLPEARRPYALIAFAAVAAALLAAGAWSLWRDKPDAEGGRLAAEASARVALDDAASLSRAIQLYDELLLRAPGQVEAEVERAVARLLTAAGQQEEIEPFADQLATLQVDRSRLDSERPPGSDEALRGLAAEAARLEAELEPRRRAAETLLAQASLELRTLGAGPVREGLAARGQVLQAALAGDRAEVDRLMPLARAAGPSPWPALAQAWIELRGSGSRELAMSRFAELVKARPEVLRARYLLARAQAMSGRHEEALSTLAGLLAANPRHERAIRLQAQLTSAASVRPAPPAESAAPRIGSGAPTEAAPAPSAAPAGGPPPQGANPPAAPPPQPAQQPRPAAPPAPQPAPPAAAPRPAAPPPRAAAPAPAGGATAAASPQAHGAGSTTFLLPAPTRIEVTRPAARAANIDAGVVTPLAPETPAKP